MRTPWSLGGVCFVIANPLLLGKFFAVSYSPTNSDGVHKEFTRSLSGVFKDFGDYNFFLQDHEAVSSLQLKQ
jgi:hypothetical protein